MKTSGRSKICVSCSILGANIGFARFEKFRRIVLVSRFDIHCIVAQIDSNNDNGNISYPRAHSNYPELQRQSDRPSR